MALVVNQDSSRTDLEYVIRHLRCKLFDAPDAEAVEEIHEDINECLAAWRERNG